MVGWTNILKEINKEIQKHNIILSKTLQMLERLTKTMESLRNETSDWIKTAKEIEQNIEVINKK